MDLTQAGGGLFMILYSYYVYQISFKIFIIADISLNIYIYNKEQVYFETTVKSLRFRNLVHIAIFND